MNAEKIGSHRPSKSFLAMMRHQRPRLFKRSAETLSILTLLAFVIGISGHENSQPGTYQEVFGLNPTSPVKSPEVTNDKSLVRRSTLNDRDDSPFLHDLDDLKSDVEIFATDDKSKSKLGKYVRYDSEDPEAYRYAPRAEDRGTFYILTEERLKKIRKNIMYWYFDKGGNDDNNGDYQTDIRNTIPQVNKGLNFQLPFYGFRFNYTRLSLHGYLEFSNPPEYLNYPLVFPSKNWPKENDPSFIGIFYAKARIGKLGLTDIDERKPGVYFRMERDLQTRTDQLGIEMYNRVKWDVREGIVGSDTFDPKHAVIATWKNVSFAGGIDTALSTTNTFQMVLATDEVYTYAIFNYLDIQWTSCTEAGGDTTTGDLGIPAFVGFNAGNGTSSYEYLPYSQATTVRDLPSRGWVNNLRGRHIFRIDEKIMLGNCNKDINGANLPLVFAPESGNMLGGTIVSISGPCFEPTDEVKCHFDTQTVFGTIINSNRAVCIQPYIKAEGPVRFSISINGRTYDWKGTYYVETAATATEYITFVGDSIHQRNPQSIEMKWNPYNLTNSLDNFINKDPTKNRNEILDKSIRISLWGYRETTIVPELLYITDLETDLKNSGSYIINSANYRNRDNWEQHDIYFGFIQINLTNPIASREGLAIIPLLWSRPIPLGWYFGPQWRRFYDTDNWPENLCNEWIMYDRNLKPFTSQISICPCILQHALNDKGRFLPDTSCDKDSNPQCYYNNGAVHCVKTGAPSLEGSEQQCCYDKNGYLMLTYDQQWGSKPRRCHNLGYLPWTERSKVPTLSQWYNDIAPMYFCCLWQYEQSVGCETFRFERRPSQDCIGYQSPAVATVFGDPHFVTFDGIQYTFNGKGEFVLLRVNNVDDKLDIQARFEQLPRNAYGEVRATQMTSLAAQGNNTVPIEVRLRPLYAQWRYRLDVLVDKKLIYFDRPSLKFQHFRGVTVYTPTYILNQSEVIIMFETGVGVEVIENKGFMAARVYLPSTYMNKTRGLLGNWSHNWEDDFMFGNGTRAEIPNINNFEDMHKHFAIEWMVDDHDNPDVGKALFKRDFGRSSNFYNNRSYEPQWERFPSMILPDGNRSRDIKEAKHLCGDNYQCQYDYALSVNRDMAHFTKNYFDTFSQIKQQNYERIISCGVLETPRFGSKSNFLFVPGTTVQFDCNRDFFLRGDIQRSCTLDGRWNIAEYGFTECLDTEEYSSRALGVTSLIVLILLIPMLLVFLCLANIFFKKRQRAREEDESIARARQVELQRIQNQDNEGDKDSPVTNSGVTYETEGGDVTGTRLKPNIPPQSESDPMDYDRDLDEAIQEAAKTDPDMEVEKIGLQQQVAQLYGKLNNYTDKKFRKLFEKE